MYTKPTTRAQREAVFKLFLRSHPESKLSDGAATRAAYRTFRRGFRWGFGDYIGGIWAGMYVGIELDGHTHS